jgi:hypothetical protein
MWLRKGADGSYVRLNDILLAMLLHPPLLVLLRLRFGKDLTVVFVSELIDDGRLDIFLDFDLERLDHFFVAGLLANKRILRQFHRIGLDMRFDVLR